jgi:serine/threonine protein kinase
MPAAPSLALPERFRDIEPLGAGAQGRTYRAFDTHLQREVAVKVLELRAVDDWKAFERFERECAVLGSLEHPGVPRYLAHFAAESAGTHMLVMELVAGRSLAEDIRTLRRRTEAQLVAITEQLLETLAYLHELHPRVIHRDIKPANVIQRDDGHVVLVDFGGVAHPLRGKGGSTMVGTFGYMAPEQLYGKADPQSDLYALGITITALAAGVEGEDLPRRGHAIVLDDVFAAGRLRAVVAAMIEVDPEARPASARDALRILHGEAAPAEASRALARPGGAGSSGGETVALSPVSSREGKIAMGAVAAGTLLAFATRSPLILLAVAGLLVVYFAITRGREI